MSDEEAVIDVDEDVGSSMEGEVGAFIDIWVAARALSGLG